jgi:pimeloyl-ACP methyl ester carboxylesterase
MEAKFLEFKDGERVYYNYNKGKAPCLIFIHGLGCNQSLWKPYFEYFGDYSVLSLDLRGHGKSDTKLNNFDDFSDDVKRILDKEKINEAILIGSCLGVPIVIDFLKKYNSYVKKTVLIGPYGKDYVRFSISLRILSEIMIFLSLFEKKKKNKGFFDYWDEKNLGVRFPFFKEFKIMPKKFYFGLLKMLLNKELEFQYLNRPFLLILGRYDLIVKNRKIKRILKENPNCNLKMIDAHHLVTTRRPKTTCKSIEEFIYVKHNNTNFK